MPNEPIREPLYDRIERLVKGRNSIVILLAVLILGRLALIVFKSATGQSAMMTGIAVGSLTLVIAGGLIGAAAFRRSGRKARTESMELLPSPTRIPALDGAIDSFEIRTGQKPPRVALMVQSAAVSNLDAELVYLPDGEPGDVRGPLDAKPSDVPVVAFTRAMVDTFDSAELMAVLVHMVNRGQLSKEPSAGSSNGVCEADSRTLLTTHDHVALLSAVQKSASDRVTPPPTMGIVRFADADLYTRDVAVTGHGIKWETRDRVAELRAHLLAAALDVPE